MRILIRVDFGAKVEKVRATWGHRELFWSTYNSLSFSGGHDEPTEDEVRTKEKQIRREFPWILRRKLLATFAGESELKLTRKMKLIGLRKAFQVIVSKIEYNSLDILLDVLGIDHEDMCDIVFSLIEMHTPAALNEAIGNTRVNFTHDFVRLDDVHEDFGNQPSGNLSKFWKAVNGASLLPLVLALAVLYMAFVAETEYLRDLRAEKTAYAERAIKENDTIYRLLLDIIKSSRQHEETLANIISESLSAKSPRSKNKKTK
jgi:hypothetical protein